jgi:hypothetical protein
MLPPDALARGAAEEYRRRARYPRSSRPLDDGPDPLERDREVSPITERGPSGEGPALTVYPLAAGFEDPEHGRAVRVISPTTEGASGRAPSTARS